MVLQQLNKCDMKKIQSEVRKFMEERDWLSQQPADVAKSIVIESAEVLEKFQWVNPSVKEVKEDKDLYRKVGMELADVIIFCAEMAIILDYDVHKLVSEKLEKQAEKYPVEKVKGHNGHHNYLAIKQEYRRKGKNE